jgi:hypothetical protein
VCVIRLPPYEKLLNPLITTASVTSQDGSRPHGRTRHPSNDFPHPRLSTDERSFDLWFFFPDCPVSPKPRPSPSSSTSTLPAPTQHERANSSLPILHQSQEVHLLTVTDDAVKLDSSTSPDSLLHKVGRSLLSTPIVSGPAPKQDLPQPALFTQPDGALNKVGPPPPSPPASDEQAADEENSSKPTPKVEAKTPAVTFGTSLRERQPHQPQHHPMMSLPRNLLLYCIAHQQRQKRPYPPALGSRQCQLPQDLSPHRLRIPGI